MTHDQLTAEPLDAIPLPEVSGLTHAVRTDGVVTIAAVGDRAARIALARVRAGDHQPTWEVMDLTEAAGTRIPARDPQLEAIATDGAGGVLLVQEWPNRAEYIDGPSRGVVLSLALEVPDTPATHALHRAWVDPDGSHTEGVVLLRDGHLLVVKEKHPAALVEFGPAGAPPLGFGPGRWHPFGQRWAQGGGEQVLVALAAWYPDEALQQACPDLSDADESPDGDLVLLSDQGSALAVVGPQEPAADPFAGTVAARRVWRLSGISAKPEGLAVLPDGIVLVACDRHKVKKNLFVVRDVPWR
ncbi:MAG: hypothetical protein MUD13_04600 [Candidatus Nanopelagicales bacterium]|jgi:hypothetical protein|nr:hypothetical protein [Candidatus Nanopelagicales bacterium]